MQPPQIALLNEITYLVWELHPIGNRSGASILAWRDFHHGRDLELDTSGTQNCSDHREIVNVYRETDIEEAYQNAIELTTALNNRQGKAIPVRLRGIIGTVDRVATTLRDLYTALRVHSIEERRHIEDPPRGPVTRSEIRRRGFRRIRK